jgi:hypothetical protein
MTEPESGDYVTLENDASTKDDGEINARWRFTMYGSRKETQSFHEQNERSGDFGERCSTMRFRAPTPGEREVEPGQNILERIEEGRLERERTERERAEREQLDRKLSKYGIPKNIPFASGQCGSREPPSGGPPALFKAEGDEAAVNTDPALEAEADAMGAKAARHRVEDAED